MLTTFAALVIWFRRARKRKLRQRFLANVTRLVNEKLDALTRRRAQLVRPDAYGKPQTEKWTKEMEYFVDNHIRPHLTASETMRFEAERVEILRLIAQLTFERAKENDLLQKFDPGMTPTEFEQFCAKQLARCGWSTQVTQGSRDQGVDVIAEKCGVRVALQCKLYSGAVGNKAVQEIAAGKIHERAHKGIVVTNSRYTSAAEQLASTNNVLLLHHTDLLRFDDFVIAEAAA